MIIIPIYSFSDFEDCLRRQDMGGYSEVLPATGAKTPPTGKGEVENRGWAHLRLFKLPGSGKFLCVV